MHKCEHVESYQPNLYDKIVVIAPNYTDTSHSIVYIEQQDGEIVGHPSYLQTTSFLEHFLHLQGTSIHGSRTSARKLYNFGKNIPLYAPLTHQVIHKYRVAAAPDPIYFFTMLYTVDAIAKKRSLLTLKTLSFTVEASQHQCVTLQQRASHYFLLKSAAHQFS
ncbi:MAG: hypothetical protein KIG60_09920 [Caryophanon sp.]|nr:hypothetical protein [Caryophanon sp.]